MRLTNDNIKFVKEFRKDGMPYMWFLAMQTNNISDCREYINYDENGRTTDIEYPKDRLPKTVQKFIEEHEPELFDEHEGFIEGTTITVHIYRA